MAEAQRAATPQRQVWNPYRHDFTGQRTRYVDRATRIDPSSPLALASIKAAGDNDDRVSRYGRTRDFRTAQALLRNNLRGLGRAGALSRAFAGTGQGRIVDSTVRGRPADATAYMDEEYGSFFQSAQAEQHGANAARYGRRDNYWRGGYDRWRERNSRGKRVPYNALPAGYDFGQGPLTRRPSPFQVTKGATGLITQTQGGFSTGGSRSGLAPAFSPVGSDWRNNPYWRNARRFNLGGIVPGSGVADKVPALLAPGEAVLNRQAVQSMGPGSVLAANSGKGQGEAFSGGGSELAKALTDFSQKSPSLASALAGFGPAADRLAKALSEMPTEVSMQGSHDLNVRIDAPDNVDPAQLERLIKAIEPAVQEWIHGGIDQRTPNANPRGPGKDAAG